MRAPAAWMAGVVLALLAGCGSGSSGVQARVDRALQRMRDQPRADAYEASGFFADGKVMQAPPTGTVAREHVLDPTSGAGRSPSGAYLRQMSVPVTPPLLARGRERFRIFCGACHGVGGFGGSVVAANFTGRRPPSLRTGPAAELLPGQLYEIITSGIGRMPSYATELPVSDRWAVVAYVGSFRGRPAADAGERDDSARGAELRRLDSLRAEHDTASRP